MKKILSSILLMAGTLTAGSANAVVTYANCPTLAPLPVTSFMPAAMLPIQTAENAFDIGMNQEHFWFWSKRMKPSSLYYAKNEDVGKKIKLYILRNDQSMAISSLEK